MGAWLPHNPVKIATTHRSLPLARAHHTPSWAARSRTGAIGAGGKARGAVFAVHPSRRGCPCGAARGAAVATMLGEGQLCAVEAGCPAAGSGWGTLQHGLSGIGKFSTSACSGARASVGMRRWRQRLTQITPKRLRDGSARKGISQAPQASPTPSDDRSACVGGCRHSLGRGGGGPGAGLFDIREGARHAALARHGKNVARRRRPSSRHSTLPSPLHLALVRRALGGQDPSAIAVSASVRPPRHRLAATQCEYRAIPPRRPPHRIAAQHDVLLRMGV
jgi:hypothetical protein